MSGRSPERGAFVNAAWVTAPRWAGAMLALVLASCLSVVSMGVGAAGAVPGFPATTTGPADTDEVEPPRAEDLESLSRLLADERVIEWLRRQADAAEETGAARAASVANPAMWLEERLRRLKADLTGVVAAWRAAPRHLREFADRAGGLMGEGEFLRSLIYVIVFLTVGAGLEWLYWRYAGDLRIRIELSARHANRPPVRLTALRAGLAALGITLFAAGTLGAFVAFDWPEPVKVLVLAFLLAVVTIRVANAAAVFVLCPRVPDLRPVPLDTPSSRFLHRWMMTAITVGCLGAYAGVALDQIALVPPLAVIVRSAAGTLVAALAITAIWRWRRAHRASRARPGTRIAAEAVPVGLTVVTLAVWALWFAGAYPLMWTLVVALAFPVADRTARALVRASLTGVAPHVASAGARVGPAAEEKPADDAPAVDTPAVDAPAVEVRADEVPADEAVPARNLYVPVFERLARFAIVVGAVVALSAAYDVDLWALSGAPTIAGKLVGASVDVLVAVLVADLLWVWARTAIDARMADYVAPEPGHAPGPEARLATLLPLLRKILMITLIAMVVLIALSSLGINVGPLLAGAGVVGIAVGFGAQALVRDIVSGIFFLLDDAFRVGEYIEVGDLRGTVESISVRSLRLRHHRGAVHTVPFGEMKSLTNHSRDWVIMKLELRVPFETDLKLVKKIVKRIGAELLEDEVLGPSIIEPLKSQGVRRMEEFNMVVGVKFMTRPGEQWLVRKEAYQRIRDAFDANGIGFAERNVKVEVVGADPESPQAREAALGAAQSTVEAMVPPDASGVRGGATG